MSSRIRDTAEIAPSRKRRAYSRRQSRYTVTGGTDALGGTRLYLTWRSPGTVHLSMRRA